MEYRSKNLRVRSSRGLPMTSSALPYSTMTPPSMNSTFTPPGWFELAFWAVIERASGELVGDAGLEVTDQGIELGYTLARNRWGRGLATEAGRLCVEAADGPLGLRRPVALADLANPASAAVLARLGFADDGIVDAYGRPHRRFVRER